MTLQELFNAFITLLAKEILRFLRIWIQTLLPSVITIALYFIIFGQLIGSQLADIKGYQYIDYIVPGMIMLSIITNAYSNVVASFYSTKFQKHIEEMLVSPMPNYVIIWGFIGGGITRSLIVGIAVTATASLFTEVHFESPVLLLTVALLTSILFSLAGLINAVFANSFDDISLIPTFVLTPLTYLGGIFYSIDMLPELWRNLSHLNPVLYMVDAFRSSMLGVSDMDIRLSLAIIVSFVLILYALTDRLLSKGVGIRS